jgi:transposase
MSAFVRPYVKSSKNDTRDAEAICKAVARRSMRFQQSRARRKQDLLACAARIRSLLIRKHTALMNPVRRIARGVQHCCGTRCVHLRRALAEIREDRDARVSELMREALVEMAPRLRRTAEQWTQEGKQPVKMTRHSCHGLRINYEAVSKSAG